MNDSLGAGDSALPPPIPTALLDQMDERRRFLAEYLQGHLLLPKGSIDLALQSMAVTQRRWRRIEVTPVWKDEFDAKSAQPHRPQGRATSEGVDDIEEHLFVTAFEGNEKRFVKPQQFALLASRLNEPARTEGCGECNGHGMFICATCDGDKAFPCGACNESGRVRCNQCDRGYKICTRCRGSGFSDSRRCSPCGGTGKLPCFRCSSRGEARCDKCKGKGYRQCNGCGGRGKLDCESCGSTGSIDHLNQRFLRVYACFSAHHCFASEAGGTRWEKMPSPENVFERRQTWLVLPDTTDHPSTGVDLADSFARSVLQRSIAAGAVGVWDSGAPLAGATRPDEESVKRFATDLCARLSINAEDLVLCPPDGSQSTKAKNSFKVAARPVSKGAISSCLMLCFIHLSEAEEEVITFSLGGNEHSVARWSGAQESLVEGSSLSANHSQLTGDLVKRLLSFHAEEREQAAEATRKLKANGRDDLVAGIVSATIGEIATTSRQEALSIGVDSAARLLDRRKALLGSIDAGTHGHLSWEASAVQIFEAASQGLAAYRQKFLARGAILVGLWLLMAYMGFDWLALLSFAAILAAPYLFPSPRVSFLLKHRDEEIGRLLASKRYEWDLCEFPHTQGGMMMFGALGVILLLVLVF